MLSVAFGSMPVRAIDRPIVVGKIWTIQDRLFQSAPVPEPEKNRPRQRTAAFACHEDVRARGAFGVGQRSVLLDDEGPAQRHHHQHAEDPPGEGEHRDLEIREERLAAFAEEEQRRDREDDTRGHRLAGRSDRLDDVVLEDGRAAEALEDRDGQDGDGNGGTHGQPGAKPQVDRGRAEDQAEERTEQDGPGRELRRGLGCRHVGLERGPCSSLLGRRFDPCLCHIAVMLADRLRRAVRLRGSATIRGL